ncbi:hypothetical protein EJ08DRAFT_693284 [Tothia fuscella]|uniref:Helicase n=1 Tax=Tothia fuscella TaxID=1048955 RepID=A0A9P4NYJ8_9PEZI|nr:hypothetical protein EJ08DRAFT_693284 [Tothia fuscella]
MDSEILMMDPDPWDWSIDDVVDEFCNSRRIWAIGRPTARLPDPVKFEKVLRDNDIDGATLISDLGSVELKNDLEVSSLGQRSSIVWGIQQLRQSSAKWKENNPTNALTPQQMLISAGGTPFSGTNNSVTGWQGFSPYRPNIIDTPKPTPAPETSNGVGGQEAFSKNDPIAPNVETELNAPNNEQQIRHEEDKGRLRENELADLEPATGQRRPAEVSVPDQNGRKKRRLTLGGPSAPLGSVTTKGLYDVDFGASFHVLPSRSLLSGIKSNAPSLLGPKKLTPDDVFFLSTRFGEQLNKGLDIRPIPDDDTPADGFELLLFPDRSVPGRQKTVYRHMLRLFQLSPVEVDVAGYAAQVIHPYSAVSGMADSSRSVILFNPTDAGFEVSRERASRFDTSGATDYEEDSNPSNHEWDFLDHWRKAKDVKELPAYGESEANTEWEKCEEEMEAEEQKIAEEEAEHVNGRLITESKVIDIVDEEVDHYIALWKASKLPLSENKSWSIWRKARSPKERLAMVDSSRQLIEYFTARLEKLKKGIIKDERWYSVKKVQDLCKTLQETVNQREEERFKVSVWLRPAAPARSKRELRTKKKVRHARASDDGFALSSDSEILDDSDEAGFVDIEELDMTDENEANSGQEQVADSVLGEVSMAHADTVGLSGKQNGAHAEIYTPSESPALTEIKDERTLATPMLEASQLRRLGQSASNIIDLTGSGDDDELEEVDQVQESHLIEESLSREPLAASGSVGSVQYGPEPLKDSEDEIINWDYDALMERSDRKRIVLKLLRTMPAEEYSEICEFITGDDGYDLPGQIFRTADNLLHHPDALKLSTRIVRQERSFEVFIDWILRLYCCWLECSKSYFEHGFQSGRWGCLLARIPSDVLAAVMEKTSKPHQLDVNAFCQFLRDAVKSKSERYLVRVSKQKNLITDDDVSDDSAETEIPLKETPHKKRKHQVLESRSAKEKRDRAIEYRLQYEERARQFETQSSQIKEPADESQDVLATVVVVNAGKKEEEPPIILNSHISRDIQPHQIEGLQFMWREVVAAHEDEEDMAGCLLAHTMGLGKTMQAIALLVTIAEASTNPDEAVWSQIPDSIRLSRTLIIVPASLIENWCDEFRRWVPPESSKALGQVRAIRSEDEVAVRLKMLERWYTYGGVLLISYDLLRRWALNNSTEKKEATFTADAWNHKIKKWLLHGPNLIVADEAHFLKNIGSKVHEAVKMFRSTSRIALTGSPLNNSLREYYATIDWISPGYLGPEREFRARYVEPIQEGLYLTSTAAERKISRKKLKTLESFLEPKIHRREVTVLLGRLKPKVEFSIKLPLTPIQKAVYQAFIESIHSDRAEVMTNARLWTWMDHLRLLCNHPQLFWEKMKQLENLRQDGSKSPRKTTKTADISVEDIDMESTEAELIALNGAEVEPPTGVVKGVMAKVAQIMEPVISSPYDINNSYKVKLLVQLLEQCRTLGDRVLLFSHSLPTLTFLEKVLSLRSMNYTRLDGMTKIGNRQSMMNDFNQGDWCVFLISTRAGGLGFNLPGANRVVLFDFGFNPTWEEQAIGRAYRLGQKKPVFVYRFFTGGTFEEELLNVAVFKIQLAYTVVEKKNVKSIANKYAKWLVNPAPVPSESLENHKGKDDVLDKILAERESAGLEHFIRAIKTTETLQEAGEDALTEEDRKEIEKEISMERLRWQDPIAYSARQLQHHLYTDVRPTPRAAPYNNVNPTSSMPAMNGRSNAAIAIQRRATVELPNPFPVAQSHTSLSSLPIPRLSPQVTLPSNQHVSPPTFGDRTHLQMAQASQRHTNNPHGLPNITTQSRFGAPLVVEPRFTNHDTTEPRNTPRDGRSAEKQVKDHFGRFD